MIKDRPSICRSCSTLVFVGPPGIESWFERVMETAFPGSSKTKQKFDVSLVEMQVGEPTTIGGLTVTPYQVEHGNPGGPFFTLRVEVEGKTITYTGDTEWTDLITQAARGADLFITEAYFRDKKVPLHLDLATVESHLTEIGAKRVILTHMSDEMLAQRNDVPYETAEDGMVVNI